MNASQKENSVFDFIYLDLHRVSLFLSQLTQLGFLENVAEQSEATRGSEQGDEWEAGSNIGIAKGVGKISHGINKSVTKGHTKTYNARWSNALEFLDFAEDAELIKRNVKEANLGDIVLVKGSLRIRDVGAISAILKKPSAQAFMRAGAEPSSSPELSTLNNRSERRKHSKNQKNTPRKEATPSEFDLFTDVIDTLNNRPQALVLGSELSWGILDENGLIGSASDFALRFGQNIQGEWAMLGVLDAEPDSVLNPLETIMTQSIDEAYDSLAQHLVPIVRQLVGRPEKSYGITPLMIFREVGIKP